MTKKPHEIKERTFCFALDTIKICLEIDKREKFQVLTKQLMRSASSVGANVREARNAESKNDFIQKLSVALKECDETNYWISLLIELTETKRENLERLLTESDEIMRVLSSIILKSKANSNWKKR
ncbi:MAG: four helix bundle protein [Fluviicola sp.]